MEGAWPSVLALGKANQNDQMVSIQEYCRLNGILYNLLNH